MRKILKFLLGICATYLLLCTAAALFLAHTTLYPLRRALPDSAQQEIRRAVFPLDATVRNVEVLTQDNVELRAWYIQPRDANSDSVILLHGLGDNRLGTTGYAEIMLAHGYSVLMPDARAHGISGGTIATYGLLERYDIKRWFEWLSTNMHPRCIFGLGESMGAAQLLQSLAVEPDFCAIVAESSFSNFREIAYDRMGQQFRSGPWAGRTLLRPVVEIALTYVKLRYHLDLAKASPERAVAGTSVPVFLVHGHDDHNIPPYHSRRIRLTNPSVELWEVPGTDHCGAISTSRLEFEQRVLAWFERHKSSHRESLTTAHAN